MSISRGFVGLNGVDLFKNIKFYSTGILDEKVSQALQVGGAKSYQYLSGLCMLCIVGKDPDYNEVSEANELLEIPAVTQDWVIGSLNCGKLLPTSAFSPSTNQLMSGVRVCISGVGREDACSIWGMVTFQGGKVESTLTATTTHLVATSTQGRKYEEALRRTDLYLVSPDWISDSVVQKVKCDEKMYHPRLLVTPGKQLANMHVGSPCLATHMSSVEKKQEMRTHVEEGHRSSRNNATFVKPLVPKRLNSGPISTSEKMRKRVKENILECEINDKPLQLQKLQKWRTAQQFDKMVMLQSVVDSCGGQLTHITTASKTNKKSFPKCTSESVNELSYSRTDKHVKLISSVFVNLNKLHPLPVMEEVIKPKPMPLVEEMVWHDKTVKPRIVNEIIKSKPTTLVEEMVRSDHPQELYPYQLTSVPVFKITHPLDIAPIEKIAPTTNVDNVVKLSPNVNNNLTVKPSPNISKVGKLARPLNVDGVGNIAFPLKKVRINLKKVYIKDLNQAIEQPFACNLWKTNGPLTTTFNQLCSRNRKMSLDTETSYDMTENKLRKRYYAHRCCICVSCLKPDYGYCHNCVDMLKFGGSGIRKQACLWRVCLVNPIVLTVGKSSTLRRDRKQEKRVKFKEKWVLEDIDVPTHNRWPKRKVTAVPVFTEHQRNSKIELKTKPKPKNMIWITKPAQEPEIKEISCNTKHAQAKITKLKIKNKSCRCGSCEPCLKADCGVCSTCLDKPKFSGSGTQKQACLKRICVNPNPKMSAMAKHQKIK